MLAGKNCWPRMLARAKGCDCGRVWRFGCLSRSQT